MPIRPIDVRRKEFRNGFRGYDANQVDDFLDAVADEFERTYTETSRLREEVSSLRERLQQFEELEGSIRSALVHAEQAANDLRRTATWEAEDVRKSAAREADLTVREAQARAHQMLAESSARVERIQETVESPAPDPEAAGRPHAEPTGGLVAETASAEDDAATRSIEPEAAEPTPEEIDSEIAELEATEPEMEPSALEEPPVQAATQDLGPAPEIRDEPAQVEEPAQTGEPASTDEPAAADEASAADEPAPSSE